jgi:hypothetical protein
MSRHFDTRSRFSSVAHQLPGGPIQEWLIVFSRAQNPARRVPIAFAGSQTVCLCSPV